jgi:hypothetical protein
LRRVPTAEEELMLLLCGTEERRRRTRARVSALTARVDFDVLSALMARQLLFPLLGSRLAEQMPEGLTSAFRDRLVEAIALARKRGTQLEMLALQLQSDLEIAGIEALPLKGTSLARNLYGDPGLRIAADIDILVRRESLGAAVEVLGHRGYRLVDDPFDNGSRLHVSLGHEGSKLPRVELHWRIHWYEEAFSRTMLEHATGASDRRRAAPADELAALLLFFSRNGLTGLRLVADIASWCDAYNGSVPLALDNVVREAPKLQAALAAAAAAAERLVGVPIGTAPTVRPKSRRTRTAVRLTNWTITGDLDQIGANITFVDWLLCPRSESAAFARRTLVPPAAQISAMYGLPSSAVGRRVFWRIVHGPKLLVRYALALWRIRGGRSWVTIPPAV